eukprot:114901-Pelagomonas_calceolata.AAC.3
MEVNMSGKRGETTGIGQPLASVRQLLQQQETLQFWALIRTILGRYLSKPSAERCIFIGRGNQT